MRQRRGRPGLVGTMARTAVVAGTATVVVGAVSGSKQKQAAAQQQQQAAAQQQQQAAAQSQAEIADMHAQLDSLQAQQAPTAAAAAAPGGDLTSEIERLATLKTAGVINDEEFAAAKAKLLA
jgi:uncharacterized protein YlxW (UPF0749 family)